MTPHQPITPIFTGSIKSPMRYILINVSVSIPEFFVDVKLIYYDSFPFQGCVKLLFQAGRFGFLTNSEYQTRILTDPSQNLYERNWRKTGSVRKPNLPDWGYYRFRISLN